MMGNKNSSDTNDTNSKYNNIFPSKQEILDKLIKTLDIKIDEFLEVIKLKLTIEKDGTHNFTTDIKLNRFYVSIGKKDLPEIPNKEVLKIFNVLTNQGYKLWALKDDVWAELPAKMTSDTLFSGFTRLQIDINYN